MHVPSLSLNVGCGSTRKYPFRDFNCDVNCDINIPEVKILNYIQCDAMNLPFRPIFKLLYAVHLLEHLNEPDSAISEFKNIARQIEIIIPHALCPYAYLDTTHRWVRINSEWRMIPGFVHLMNKPHILRWILWAIHILLGLPRELLIKIKGNI